MPLGIQIQAFWVQSFTLKAAGLPVCGYSSGLLRRGGVAGRVSLRSREWMLGDQKAFIAWSVQQINRNSKVVAWERIVLAALVSSPSALARLFGQRLQETLTQHRDQQAQLDAFNEFAFGDISDEEL